MTVLTRTIDVGCRTPKWWGSVRSDHMNGCNVIAPIGLNVALRLWWIATDWIRCPFRKHRTWTERKEIEVWNRLVEQNMKTEEARYASFKRRVEKAAEAMLIQGWRPSWYKG